MSCCCERVFKLCAVPLCDGNELQLPIPVAEEGDFTLELDFLGAVISIKEPQVVGDNMYFSKDSLNEQFTYVGHVLNDAGEKVKFTVGEKEYDCVEFTTKRIVHDTGSSL